MNFHDSRNFADSGGYINAPNFNPDPRTNFSGYPYFNPQLINNPVTNMLQDHVTQYSDNLVNKGKTWFSNNLKYYFAVDTGYVLKKLLLLFFPFTHKDWSLRYRQEEPIAPKDDFNAPDLYIPTMAFVTYILVAGYLLGLNEKFSPEQLGIQASSALGWFLFEIIVAFISLYVMNLSSAIGFFHVMALSGYKFVFMITALLINLIFSQFGYYFVLLYSSVSLGFFLLRSLHITIETNVSNYDHLVSSKNTLYLSIAFCLFQPISMYILTRHLIVCKS